jgi:hypothetical protein
MIEIIALIFLTRHIGPIAIRKGQSPGRWKLYTVLGWFTAEVVGLALAFAAFGKDDLLGIGLLGLASAFGGYLIVKAQLDKFPDYLEDDIDSIGS